MGYTSDENVEKYLLAIVMQIEMIMDVSATLFAPYMAYAFLPLKEMFMFHFPGKHLTATFACVQEPL